MSYGGLPIIFDANVLEDTKERLFPESRHRSARIRKKLIKRFGGEFRKQPCIWKVGDRFVAHPIYRAEIERHFRQASLDNHPVFAVIDSFLFPQGRRMPSSNITGWCP